MPKRQNWASMAPEVRFDTVLKEVKEISKDGVFKSRDNPTLYYVMKQYGIREEILKEVGLAVVDNRKWASMTPEELYKTMLKEVRKVGREGVFKLRDNLAINRTMQKYGIREEILKEAGLVVTSKRDWASVTSEDILEKVKKAGKDGVFKAGEYPALNRAMVNRGIREEILKEAGLTMFSVFTWAAMTPKVRFDTVLKEVKEVSKDGIFKASEYLTLNNTMNRYGIREKILKEAGLTLANKDWASMTPEVRFDTVLKEVKEVGKDGIFKASDNPALNNAMNRYGIREEILKEAGLVMSDRKRNWISNMTTEERMEYAVAYIKENAVDGKFAPTMHQKFYDSFRKSGIYSKAMRVALNTRGDEEILDEFIEIMKPYRKEHIRSCNTPNELVATILPEAKDKILSRRDRKYLILFLTTIFPAENITLGEFTEEAMEELLIKRKLTGSSRQTKKRFIDMFLKSSLDDGVFIPFALKHCVGRNVENYATAMKNKIKQPKTLYEYFLYNWNIMQGGIGKYTLLHFFHNNANISPEEFEWKTVLEYFSRAQSSVIKREIFRPLQEQGIISKDFFEGSREALLNTWIKNHFDIKDNIAKAERTIMWYVGETFKDEIMNLSGHKKTSVVRAFKEIIHIKAADFTSENLKNLKNTGSYREVIEKMIGDGVCSHDILKQDDEEFDEYNWDADIWYYGKHAKYDFAQMDKVFREPAKKYIKEKTNKLTKRLSGFQDLVLVFREFSKMGLTSIYELSEDKKKTFYFNLKSMSSKGIEEHAEALRMLLIFRSFVDTLMRLNYDKFDKSLKVKGDKFFIKKFPIKITIYSDEDMLKILEFVKSDESITGEFMNRIEVCAFGLLALLARRIGEIVKSPSGESTGLRISAIKSWGVSGEYGLSYYSPKHKAWEFVLLNDLVCDRTDPFSKELIDLTLSLFDEAINITSKFRNTLPDELKDLLFIVPGQRIGHMQLNAAVLQRKMYKVFKAIGIERKGKTSHSFRHTIATNIILSGGTVADAADALGDTPNTVARYYHEFTSRIDTLKHFAVKGRTQMVDAMNDSAHFAELDKKQHKVLMPGEMSEDGHKVVGGNCVSEIEHRLNCPTYQMTNSPDGCAGCRYLEVNAVENKDYWLGQMKVKAEAMGSLELGSNSYRWERAGFERAKVIVEDIEQKELENEFG